MLRITVQRTRNALTFQLEGILGGVWLRELEECWNSALAGEPKSVVRVDLTGVTFIDDAGKACLATMHSQGAEFIAPDCVNKDVVREICEELS